MAAGALYAKLQLTPTLYVRSRGDYFRRARRRGRWHDAPAPIFWPTQWLASRNRDARVPADDGLSVRLEVRHDHAKDRVFFGGDVIGDGVVTPYPQSSRQNTLILSRSGLTMTFGSSLTSALHAPR